jgi:hypothetical protein
MVNYTWTCSCCRKQHDELPTRWHCGPPLSYAALPPDEAAARVEMNDDMCIIDDALFFVRGELKIPVVGSTEDLIFSVWVSLSEQSMNVMVETWNDPDRADRRPFFGWLNSRIDEFGDTVNLPTDVVVRPPGVVPLIVVTDHEHPIAKAQEAGVTLDRVARFAERAMPRH